MSPRLAAFLLAFGLLAAPARPDEPGGDVARGKELLAEGDRLADEAETTGAVLRYKQAFEQILPRMRKIPFKYEVRRDVTRREGLREVLLKEIDDEMTPEEFRGQELGMKALGLLPRSLDYKDLLVRVYSEEIAAFYDPKTKTMHLIEEPANRGKKPTFLEKLMGKKGGFDKVENKTVIAHELTHALADQHYDLDRLHREAKGDDDRDLALSALIEGEATLTMLGAQMEDWEGDASANLPAGDLDRSLGLLGPALALGGGAALRQAPPILSETLVFPYLRGLVFAASLTNAGGWAALDEAYRRPPLSTEQVLHPEKYAARPDPPTSLDLGPLDPGPGWKEVARNVVGELQVAILLRRFDGKAAASGWDGDTFAAFEAPDGDLGLVWLTTWDRPADAREFARSYLRFQGTKLGDDVPAPGAFPDSTRRPHRGAMFAVERRGQDVAIVEGFPSPTTESLVESALAAKRSEKTAAPVRLKGADREGAEIR